jgi:hypothetical protein
MSDLSDIEFYRGDTYPLTLTISDSVTGLPVDISAYTFTLTVDSVSEPEDGSTVIFSLTGTVDPNQVVNKGKVVFTPSEENNSLVGVYYYDIQMEKTGYVKTIKKGYTYSVIQDITK